MQAYCVSAFSSRVMTCLGTLMVKGKAEEGMVRMGGSWELSEDVFVGRRSKDFDSIGASGVGGEDSRILNFERRYGAKGRKSGMERKWL